MMAEIVNHLWQSTLFAVAVAVLVMAFRHNQARIRYWLWLAASAKFLVPFGVLVDLGSRLNWLSTLPIASSAMSSITSPAMPSTVRGIMQPLTAISPELPAGLPVSTFAGWPSFGLALAGVWICGCAAIVAVRTRAWWRIREAVRASVPWNGPATTAAGVPLRVTSSLLEPGVVGFWRPVILLPAGIEAVLTPRQLTAVLAHEICHVRRRDNLTAALHMIVEAVCWFHPAVWWIGGRLLHERERACDEHVLGELREPEIYAHGILNVCRRYVQGPLISVAGVGRGHIKARLDAILSNHVGARLSWPARVALVTAAAITTVVPIAAGVMRAQQQEPILDASFDVASFKRNVNGDANFTFRPLATGEFTVINMPLATLVAVAFQLQRDQLIGAPAWARDERYDILAKLDPKTASRLQPDGHPPTWALALRRLLVERTQLTFHRETRQLPIYALAMARPDRKLGPNIRPAQADCDALRTQSEIAAREGKPSPYPPGTPTYVPCGLRNAPGRIVSGGFGFAGEFLGALSIQTGRTVVDRTGLSGRWDLYVEYAPTPVAAGGAADANLPDLFTALQEQLGLKLESTTGPVQVFVIDHVERPSTD